MLSRKPIDLDQNYLLFVVAGGLTWPLRPGRFDDQGPDYAGTTSAQVKSPGRVSD